MSTRTGSMITGFAENAARAAAAATLEDANPVIEVVPDVVAMAPTSHGAMVEQSVIDAARIIEGAQARGRVVLDDNTRRKPVNVAVPKGLADALAIFVVHTGTRRTDVIQELLVNLLRNWDGGAHLPAGWDRVGEKP